MNDMDQHNLIKNAGLRVQLSQILKGEKTWRGTIVKTSEDRPEQEHSAAVKGEDGKNIVVWGDTADEAHMAGLQKISELTGRPLVMPSRDQAEFDARVAAAVEKALSSKSEALAPPTGEGPARAPGKQTKAGSAPST